MKKRKMILIIALISAAVVLACTQQKYDDESDFKVEPVDGGKSVRIIEYLGSKQTVSIPPRIGNFPVTHIGDATWNDDTNSYSGSFANKSLISVTIPNSVTSIGDYAFAANQLTSVTIPNSVTAIGKGAFSTNQLTSVTIPSSTKEIGIVAFYGNQLTSVTIPNSVTSLEDYAFAANQLTSVTIPNSVTAIGEGAFATNQLASVTIPNSVTTIGDYAFYDNQKLEAINVAAKNPNFSSVDGFLCNKDGTTLLESPAGKSLGGKPVTIPNSVTTIGKGAFNGNQLASIIIPDNVTAIGDGSFYNSKLTNITIGKNVTSIGKDAFCENELPSIIIPDSVTSIGDNAFSIFGNGWPYSKLTSITIGAKVTLSIGTVDVQGERGSFRYIDSFSNNGFTEAYTKYGKAAGTYTRPNTDTRTWTKIN